MWPPALPDLNPMEFSVWSMLKAKISCVAHPSFDALKTCILREWAKINQGTMCVLVSNFRQRIKLPNQKEATSHRK